MPANLPPQYFEEEKKLKFATTPQQKIEILKNMLAIMPKHKGTEGLQAEIKTKIAKLTKEIQKKSSTRIFTFHIKKEGAGQVLLLGYPNSGKSAIFTCLTNVNSPSAEYPFTTTNPVIGMMNYENIKIQLVDMPALNHQFTKKWLNNLVFSANLLLFVVDVSNLEDVDMIIQTVPKFESKPIIVCANKIDIGDDDTLQYLKEEITTSPIISTSTITKQGMDALKSAIFLSLNIIRVYTKEPGKEADLGEPFVLPKGSTVIDVASSIHKDFITKLKYTRLWRKDKIQGLRVEKNFVLEDNDIIELHI